MIKKIRNWFIERIPLSTRLHIGRVLVVLLPVLTVAKPTFANPFALGGLIAGAALLLSPGIKAIIGGVISIILAIISVLTNLMIGIIDFLILPGQNSILFSPIIQEVWQSMQSAANVLFFVAILAMSVLIITRSTGYNFKKAITSLITAVVLANFSFIIVRVLVEAGDALRNSAEKIFGLEGSGTAKLLELFYNLETLNGWGMDIGGGGPSLLEYTLTGVFMIVVSLLGLYIFFRLAFILIERSVQLILKAIFAPFIFALSVLPSPEFQKMQSKWWSDTIRWVLVLPLAFLLFGIAHKLMVDFQLPSVNQMITTGVTNTGEFIFAIVIIAILLQAASVHTMLEIPLSSATKLFADTIPGAIGNAAKGSAIFFGGAALRGAGLKLKEKTKVGKWAYRQVDKAKARRQAAEGIYRVHKKAVVSGGNLETVLRANSAREKLEGKMDTAMASELGIGVGDLKSYKKTNEKEYDAAKEKIAPKFASEKVIIDGLEMAAMVAQGEMTKDNFELRRTPKEVNKSLVDNMAKAKKAYDSGQIRKAKEYEANALTELLTLKDISQRSTGQVRDDATGYYNDASLKDYAEGSALLGQGGTPINELAQPKMRTKEIAESSKRNRDDGYTGSASGSSATPDKQQLQHFAAKDSYDKAQAAQKNAAEDVKGDGGFVATVNATNNQAGGSAVLQMLQESATKNETTEKLDTITEVAELLAKMSPESEDTIAGLQGKDQGRDEFKSALQRETGMSAEDSEKAAGVLNDIGVKNIANAGAVAASLSQSRKSEDGRVKAKIDYIQQTQVTATTTKEYESSKANQTSAESLEVNEQRIREASRADNPESYPIQEIQADIERATQQLSQMILNSANNTEDQLKTYQRKEFGRIEYKDKENLRKLTTKIFGKLKHLNNGSIIESEEQIDTMTPKQIYNLLEASGASANKLSEGNK